LKARNPKLLLQGANGGKYYFLPSRQIDLSTSKGVLRINVDGTYLPKNELAILDLLYSNDWERSIYFNFTSLNSLNINLKPYLSQEGLVYKLVQEGSETGEIQVNLEKSYENLVVNANYTNLGNPEIYFNHEDYQTRMITPVKFTLNALINGYAKQGNMEKANELTMFAYENLYFDDLEPSYADIQLAGFLEGLEMNRESEKLVRRTREFFYEKIWRQLDRDETPARNDLIILQESTRLSKDQSASMKYRELVGRLKTK
jgi:hypothetical protein